jgi:ketosteroid isomerase-like protein
MTVDELIARESIRHTLATYNTAGDSLRVDEFIAVFTDDAILESGSFRNEGRQAIHNWMTRWSPPTDAATKARKATFVRHHLTTSKIEFTGPTTAKGRTYFAVYTDIGPDHCGYYTDVFRKSGERWLIAHRKVRIDWVSPDSLMSTPTSSAQ